MIMTFILHLIFTYLGFGVLYYVIGGLTTGDWDGNGWFNPLIILLWAIPFHPFFLADVLMTNPKASDRTFVSVIYGIILLAVAFIWTVI